MSDPQRGLFDAPTPRPPASDADPCERRHGGNDNSREAFEACNAKVQRERVHAAIAAAGDAGLTVDELSARWEVPPNSISGRFSELKRAGRIAACGRRPTRSGSTATAYLDMEP